MPTHSDPPADASAPEADLPREQILTMTLGEYLAHMGRNETICRRNHFTGAVLAALEQTPLGEWPETVAHAVTVSVQQAAVDHPDPQYLLWEIGRAIVVASIEL